MVRNLPINIGDVRDEGSIPGLGRSPGEEKGYPLQYSGLENSMGYIVHGIAKSCKETEGLSFYLTFRLPKIEELGRFLFIIKLY